MLEGHWSERASCRNHPVLEPDAWHGVRYGYPENEGASAALVCRFVCPVKAQCKAEIQGPDIIAGGGWYNRFGVFTEPAIDEIEVNQAAAYIGIMPLRLRNLVRRRKMAHRKAGNHMYLALDDVQKLATEYGPLHGTCDAHRLHIIRGEEPCSDCQQILAGV